MDNTSSGTFVITGIRLSFACTIIKNENVISPIYLNVTSRKSQKLIPSKKNQSFPIAKISSR